jgi:DNA modification methylase
MPAKIVVGNCLEKLREMPEDSVHACVSSPPYWGLRDYGVEQTLWGDDPDCVHEFADETVVREIRKGVGLEELGKRYRGGGKKQGQIERFTIHRGTCMKCGAWRGSLGLEPTPEMFVEHLADVYDEVRRVLRPDGTCWVNIGDSYASGGGAGDQGRDGDRFARAHTQKFLNVNRGGRFPDGKHGGKNQKRVGSNRGQRGDGNAGVPFTPMQQPNRSPIMGLKAKDLVGVPWMLAFELRRRGWYLRQEIIWHKPNPMPESTEDRCTKAHEHVFLLAKSERYFYDAEAIKERSSGFTNPRGTKLVTPKSAQHGSGIRANESWHAATGDVFDMRNKRTVWSGDDEERESPWPNHDSRPKGSFAGQRAAAGADVPQSFRTIVDERNRRSVWTIATTPFKEAHFATFPPALVEPCIKAGTSQRGCCQKCSAPWERITTPTERYLKFLGRSYHDHGDDGGKGQMQQRGENRQNALREEGGMVSKEHETVGWYPTCRCDGLKKLPPLPQSPRLRPPEDAGDGWEPSEAEKAYLEIQREIWRFDCGVIYGKWRLLCRASEKLKTSPAVVLDPFGGAGTTGLVADRLGRDAVLVELKADYAEMARRRIEGESMPLFSMAAE